MEQLVPHAHGSEYNNLPLQTNCRLRLVGRHQPGADPLRSLDGRFPGTRTTGPHIGVHSRGPPTTSVRNARCGIIPHEVKEVIQRIPDEVAILTHLLMNGSIWVVFYLIFHPKWDAPEQVDLTGDVPGATQEDLFGHDARPRPASKPRPTKKTKSDATASTGGSSASTQFGELMEQELRLKREAVERAFEAQAEKDRTLMWLEELRFLATSTKDLNDDDAYWIKKQKQLIKNKMRNDLDDEDDEDEDE
ncbi:hypothetical protein Tco_0807159 [Tanacetum coccineum]